MKLFTAIWDLATLPIEIAKDLVTIGGVATDRRTPYTLERLQKLDNDLS